MGFLKMAVLSLAFILLMGGMGVLATLGGLEAEAFDLWMQLTW